MFPRRMASKVPWRSESIGCNTFLPQLLVHGWRCRTVWHTEVVQAGPHQWQPASKSVYRQPTATELTGMQPGPSVNNAFCLVRGSLVGTLDRLWELLIPITLALEEVSIKQLWRLCIKVAEFQRIWETHCTHYAGPCQPNRIERSFFARFSQTGAGVVSPENVNCSMYGIAFETCMLLRK